MPAPAGPANQRSPNPLRRIGSTQQHRHRQQYVRRPTTAALCPPRTKRILRPVDSSSTGMTTSGQNPNTAAGALDLPRSPAGTRRGQDRPLPSPRLPPCTTPRPPPAGQDTSGSEAGYRRRSGRLRCAQTALTHVVTSSAGDARRRIVVVSLDQSRPGGPHSLRVLTRAQTLAAQPDRPRTHLVAIATSLRMRI